jgi:hypothetical protein
VRSRSSTLVHDIKAIETALACRADACHAQADLGVLDRFFGLGSPNRARIASPLNLARYS